MNPVLSMLAGAALFTVAGTALAEEPVTLSAADLDAVTAGAEFASAVGASTAIGNVTSATSSFSTAQTFDTPGLLLAQASNRTAGSATSFVLPPVSASNSQSIAVLQ